MPESQPEHQNKHSQSPAHFSGAPNISAYAQHPNKSPDGQVGKADEASGLAHDLEPALIATCQGRLTPVQWFKSAWQAGGAATGFSRFQLDSGQNVDVVVKLPVAPTEYRWTTALGGMPHLSERILEGPLTEEESHLVEVSPGYACAMGPTPRVYAAGTQLGGRDLAWVVVERLKGQPLSKNIGGSSIRDLLRTAAEWYAAAERIRPLSEQDSSHPMNRPPSKDWQGLITKSRELIPLVSIESSQRWRMAVKRTLDILPMLLDIWENRTIDTWCHGDLHPGNAMRRDGVWWFAGHHSSDDTLLADLQNAAGESGIFPGSSGRSGGCVLIDLALVHPGHWVEDAVYLERLFWGRTERLEGIKPVSFLAQCRRELGLPTGNNYTLLANIRRILMAACVPNLLTHEGHPKYVLGALEVLERSLSVAERGI